MSAPRIRKAQRVIGDTLVFRNATVDDARFILSLRTGEHAAPFLNPTPDDIAAQVRWLEDYTACDDQAYFIVEFDDEPVGTLRLYDAEGDSFCWGSWIMAPNRPRQAAMESTLMVYAYGLDHLGFSAGHFDIRKWNDKVLNFHERLGAERIGETELSILFSMPQEAIATIRKQYTEFLRGNVEVEPLQ